jgi:2-aminobenzoate-CoA ligase
MALLRAGELATICRVARPALALCDHRFTDELEAAGVPGLRIITYGDATADDDLTRRAARMPGDFGAVATAADDVAMIAFTSGTTGRPKAAMHFHRDLLAIADTFSSRVLKPRAEDVFTGTPPLAFTYGLGGLLVFPLRAGASTLLLEKATPAELADQIEARGVTVLSTAPTAFRAMLAAGKAAQLRGLRRPVSAGEHLPGSTWQAFYDATGVKIIDGIGSTEMLHIFISSADDDIRAGSTGRAVPGYEAAILDAEGKPVPDGTPGRLAVKGPTGCRYLADDRQRSYVADGWNLTGDTYVRDADGYFWYQARSDDMIISGGYNIAGPEIEEVLLGHPDVAECGVVGVPDEARGQIVTAYVVLRDGADSGAAEVSELQDYVKKQIAPYKYPRSVQFLDALPRTNTGKLQRFRLRDLSGS